MKHGQEAGSSATSGNCFSIAADEGATKEKMTLCSYRGLFAMNVLLRPNVPHDSHRFHGSALASTADSPTVQATRSTSLNSTSKNESGGFSWKSWMRFEVSSKLTFKTTFT